jgi:hypothetical protein
MRKVRWTAPHVRSTHRHQQRNQGSQAGTRIQADRIRRQIAKLGNFLYAGRGFNNTGSETLERPSRLIRVVNGGASSAAPDHVEAFPNDVSKLSAASGNYMSGTVRHGRKDQMQKVSYQCWVCSV